ncbi:hypothetical protein [Xanthomonas oryzae]|uniref:hypothetical protein n=1 Tax=Xanthomonas oryzae TaxID=347 RepID=UPI0001693BBD|nr:hypothetical protein [Xanthomonas oryzae]AKO21633.1 hypothetical protein ACU11_21600 [Xanthomonas oryzae pv. oryzicola]PUE93597.1 hypothetical protein C7T79_13160 [Xanthomonas oryzae pv. oryzicola]WVN08596.1 hypothetical protein V1208_21855 [Xanthomonas oryzae pv. oryzicola]
MQTIGNVWLWGGFALVVIAALLVDLVLMRHGGTHKVTFREATWWSIGWLRRVGGGACRDLRRTQRADGCLLWQPWVPFLRCMVIAGCGRSAHFCGAFGDRVAARF